MELATLQIFTEVMRQGSFAIVARDRNIDPSSVSRTIASLEKELGVRLFQRTTRQLAPTEAGSLYYEQVEPLIGQLQQANASVTDISNQPQGTLRITASVSFGLICLVPLLPVFAKAYPDLHLDLILSDAVLDLIGERIDLAIRLGVMADSSAIAQRLIPTRYHVCASPQYLARTLAQGKAIQQPQDIAAHECLRFPLAGFRSGWHFKNLRDPQGKIETVAVRGRIVISSAIALRDCAIAHMGLSLLPNWLIRPELAAGHLVSVLPHHAVTATHFETAAWLVYPSRSYQPLKVKVLIDFLKQQFATSAT